MKNYQHCKVYLTMFSTRSTRRRSWIINGIKWKCHTQ
jgi:hypothetical protein